MSTTPTPVPGRPPGHAREALLAYFKDWPKGMTVTSIKQTEWSPERDREDDDNDDVDDLDEGSAPPVNRPENVPPGEHMAKRNGWDMNNYKPGNNFARFATPRGEVRVEWYYMTQSQWKARPQSKEPGWVVTRVTYQKVIVMRVLV
jgi:hypothetical protein